MATVDTIRSISESKSAFADAALPIADLPEVAVRPGEQRILILLIPGRTNGSLLNVLPRRIVARLLREQFTTRQRKNESEQPRRQTTTWPHGTRERSQN